MIQIRNEKESDYSKVEEITRKAFYNLYIPGCVEHYLVHIMRNHRDFVPELDFVIELDNTIIGNIMYTKSKLVDENKKQKEILTFGPVCILPEYQRKGYGKMLLEYSFKRASEMGYDVIVIFGSPSNYVSCGFKSCKKYLVCDENGKYPTAMMVKEIKEGTLGDKKWFYYYSEIMNVDEKKHNNLMSSLKRWKKDINIVKKNFIC